MTAMLQPSRSVLILPCFAVGLLAAAALAPRQASAQSFDCRAAHYPDEIAICRDSDLARLDQRLATAYRRDIGALPPERRDEFQRHEIYFLNARHRCGTDRQCIAQSYGNRIHELENLMALGKAEEGGDTARVTISSSPPQPDRTVEGDETAKGVAQQRPEPAAASRPEPQSASASHVETRSTNIAPVEPPPPNISHVEMRPAKAARTEPPPSTISRVETRPAKAAPTEPQPENTGSSTPPADEAATAAKPQSHKSHHHVKRQQQTIVVTTTPAPPPEPEQASAPAKQRVSAAAPAKPTIEWANPPPSR